MKHLVRAITYACKYKYSLAGAVFCAFMVAICWGANIGAVYPFVEIVFRGESAKDWMERREKTAIARSEELTNEIAKLSAQRKAAEPDAARKLDRKIRFSKQELELEQHKIAATRRFAPMVEKYLPDTAFKTLVCVVAFLMVGTIVKGLFLIGNMVLVSRVGLRAVLDVQNEFFYRTLKLDLKSIGENGTGDLVGRIRGETSAIGNAITTLFGKTLREPLKMAVCLTGAALVNWRLLVFSMLICPLAVFLLIRLVRSTKRASRRAMEESALLVNRLFQSLTYIKIVKAYNMENHERSRFSTVAKQVYRRSMRITWYTSLFRLNNEILGIGVISLSVLAGGYLVLNQQTHLWFIRLGTAPMDIPQIMAFFAFLIGASDPLRKMADVYHSLQGGIVAAERVFALLDRETSIKNPRDPKPVPSSAASIRFENVDFEYIEGKPVLRDVNLEVKAGETLAIVGANGSGKSTLVNLLPRFFDPSNGAVYLDEINLRDFRLKDLRKHIGLVTQQTMLFDDTVMNNIRYGSPGASDEQVIAAARKAHANRFINSQLQDGYDTNVGEHGGRLSGGQRQRLSLARAILRDPKLLVLDEATSQIDPESEITIHKVLSEFKKGRTTIIITHRLSTLDLADRIAVFEEGHPVDVGTHDELIQRSDLYRRIRQTELKESA